MHYYISSDLKQEFADLLPKKSFYCSVKYKITVHKFKHNHGEPIFVFVPCFGGQINNFSFISLDEIYPKKFYLNEVRLSEFDINFFDKHGRKIELDDWELIFEIKEC